MSPCPESEPQLSFLLLASNQEKRFPVRTLLCVPPREKRFPARDFAFPPRQAISPAAFCFSFTAKAISRTIFPLSSSETPVLARRNHREFEHQLSRKPPTFCDASLLRLVKPHILRGLPHALLQKRMQEAAFDYAPRHPESTVLYQVVAQELETFPAQTEGAGSSGSTFC